MSIGRPLINYLIFGLISTSRVQRRLAYSVSHGYIGFDPNFEPMGFHIQKEGLVADWSK